MSYFIIDEIVELNQLFTVKGEEAIHLIKSRRVEKGDLIEVQDSAFNRFLVKVETVGKRELNVIPIQTIEPPLEPPVKINLCQALVKEKAMDYIIQKTTELGVATIRIFHSAYSQTFKKDVPKQLSRWEKISLEACKQSGRRKPPHIFFHPNLASLNKECHLSSENIPTVNMITSGQSQDLHSVSIKNSELNLLIGPEGGWKEKELDPFNTIGVSMGPRILRSDTAAIAALSVLQYIFGDLK
ncbi:16S rRNA (uracil(1498)-N(3))-methyltransferase [bacterium]|nr:16S rRNA (uracil(1498)-N(3))-methyltransferase [bacterium]